MNETIGFLLNDSARLYRRAFNARTKGSGITALQWRLITYLKRHAGIRQGPLAELIEVEPITLSRMVDRLVEAELVERRADPADRRRWRLHLTAKAHAVVDEMEVIAAALRNEALHGIAAADFDTLLRVLGQIKNNLAELDRAGEAVQEST